MLNYSVITHLYPSRARRWGWRCVLRLNVVLIALGATGCGSEGTGEGNSSFGDSRPTTDRLASIHRDLRLGSRGDDVRALHEYLTAYGYFTNDELAQKYPSWRPIIEPGPAADTIFDERTELAVHELQKYAALPETGVADEATLGVLRSRRCGVPDGTASLDSSDKFALLPKWNKTSLTWRFINTANTGGVTNAQFRLAISSAFASWAIQSGLEFRELLSSTPDIVIQFASLDGVGNLAAIAAQPNQGGDVLLDSAERWSVSGSTPPGSYDVETMVLHEIGHALGLDHSSFHDATMWPFTGSIQDRMPAHDDKVAISAHYDAWQPIPGDGRDISVNATGGAWKLGTTAAYGGYLIYQWNGTNWDQNPDGVALRIAVSPMNVPWITTHGGGIFRRSSAHFQAGSWEAMPGCATDIAIGADSSVWSVSCTAAFGGYTIQKWNPSTFQWNMAPGVVGRRIAVDRMGVPWITSPVGPNRVYRGSTNDPATVSWTNMNLLASDLAIDSVGYTYALSGSSQPLYVWNEQTPVLNGNGTVVSPRRNEWVRMAPFIGDNGSISAGPGGVWYTDQNFQIFRPTK